MTEGEQGRVADAFLGGRERAIAGPLSAWFVDQTMTESPDPVTVGEMVRGLPDRGYGLLFFGLAAPNLTPGPSLPFFSTIFALPLVVVAFQLMIGRERPSLPRFIAGRQISRARLRAVWARLSPLVIRLEHLMKPRIPALVGGLGERLVGAAVVILALAMALPIPILCQLPSVAVMIVGVGRMEHDGLAIVLGLVAGAASVAVMAAVLVFAAEWLGLA